MRHTARLLLFLGVFALSPVLAAQELRGTVRLSAAGEPAAGVIIEALRRGSADRVASTLTDSRGYYILRLIAGEPVMVRALRIGQRPTILGDFTLAAGEVRTADVELSGAAIVLDRVRVVGQRICGPSSDRTATALTLLDEARKALRATQLISTQGELSATWELRSQRTTLRGDAIGGPTLREFRGRTSQPFVSLAPDSLAEDGYRREHDGESTYYAPDADVLLSDSFVAGHCFRTEPWTRDDRDWVGVGFSAARTRRDVVDIEGTLWLDRESAELRRLEYRYSNLPREIRDAPAGGDVQFLRLPTGVWLVERWEIRMPRLTETEEPVFRGGVQVGTTRSSRLRSMEVAGGAVREIRGDRGLLFTTAGAETLVAPSTSPTAMAELCPNSLAANEGLLWGVVSDSAGNPRSGAQVRVEWRQNARWIAEWQRSWDTRGVVARTADDGLWLACGVPKREILQVSLEGSGRAAHPIVIPWEELGLEVALSSPVAAVPVGRVAGVVIDSLRRGAAWANAQLRVIGGPWQAVSDSSGRFVLDGLPEGRHRIVVLDDELRTLGVPMPEAMVEVRGGLQSSAVVASPTPERLYESICGVAREPGLGVIVGELRDVAGARRAGVAVQAEWVRTLLGPSRSEQDRRLVADTTDAAGRYTLCGIPVEGEAAKSGDLTTYFSGEVSLSANAGSLGTDPVGVRLDGAVIRRRDLVAGDARSRTRISGRVLDHLGQPIEGATVVVGGLGGRSVQTSAAGVWVIDSVPVRTTTLAIRALRFSPFARELDPIGGRFNVGEVRLELAPQVLAASVTTARGGGGPQAWKAEFEERRRASASGTFIDDEAIKRQPTLQQTFVVRQISKARLSWDSSGRGKIGFEVDSGMGAMSLCYPRWFIDGVDYGQPEAFEEQMWLAQAVRVEVYKATEAPSRYTDFNGCGVILIWTR